MSAYTKNYKVFLTENQDISWKLNPLFHEIHCCITTTCTSFTGDIKRFKKATKFLRQGFWILKEILTLKSSKSSLKQINLMFLDWKSSRDLKDWADLWVSQWTKDLDVNPLDCRWNQKFPWILKFDAKGVYTIFNRKLKDYNKEYKLSWQRG